MGRAPPPFSRHAAGLAQAQERRERPETRKRQVRLEVQLVPAGLAPMRRMTADERIRLRAAKARLGRAGHTARGKHA